MTGRAGGVAARSQPALYSHLEVLDSQFCGVWGWGEWTDFRSIREVYEHNREIFERVQVIADEPGIRQGRL